MTEVANLSHRSKAIAATDMEMPEGKQQRPNALHEAVLWYLRSAGKSLSASEQDELESWLRRSPENVSAFFLTRAVVRRTIRHRRSKGRIERILARVLHLDGSATFASLKQRALSSSYYTHVNQQSVFPKIGLNGMALCGVVTWLFLDDVRPLKMAAVAFACFVLLKAREAVIGFRVAQGYFGSTESEVRDFVKFIVAHRRDIDFTDQGGKRRPSLVPNPAQTGSGLTAHTGALPE